MRKSKIILTLFFLFLIVGFSVYFYVYQSHRNISLEKAEFVITPQVLSAEFKKNEDVANQKYLNKTIVVSGKISNLDFENKVVSIDTILSAICTTNNVHFKINDTIRIKGRFIGYDDLLNEFKMDQCILME